MIVWLVREQQAGRVTVEKTGYAVLCKEKRVNLGSEPYLIFVHLGKPHCVRYGSGYQLHLNSKFLNFSFVLKDSMLIQLNLTGNLCTDITAITELLIQKI